MKEKILVSVIIPVYQAENYLLRCVQSVRDQTYKNLEILLIDDGSTDKSPAICDNMALLDKRIRTIHQKNGGISAARNKGLQHAKGTYITFLDSDDFLHHQFIKYLLWLCLKNRAQIAEGRMTTGSESDFHGVSVKGGVKVYDRKQAILSRKMKSGVAGKLYHRELFKDLTFPVSDHFNYEDEALVYQLTYRCENVAYTGKPLYYCYQNPQSVTRNSNPYKSTDFYKVLTDRIHFFMAIDKELLEHSYEYICVNLIRFYIICKSDPNNRNDMKELLKLYEKMYFKALYSSITPLSYKIMFTCFYLRPELCARIANLILLPIKKRFQR
jgi:glycosyltransferase involved in cell wall biosynthesis